MLGTYAPCTYSPSRNFFFSSGLVVLSHICLRIPAIRQTQAMDMWRDPRTVRQTNTTQVNICACKHRQRTGPPLSKCPKRSPGIELEEHTQASHMTYRNTHLPQRSQGRPLCVSGGLTLHLTAGKPMDYVVSSPVNFGVPGATNQPVLPLLGTN